MYEGAGTKKVGNELEFSKFLAPLQFPRRLRIEEPFSQMAQTHLCTPTVLTVLSPYIVSFTLENVRRSVGKLLMATFCN